MKDIDKLRESDDDRLLREEGQALEEYMQNLYSEHHSEDIFEELLREIDVQKNVGSTGKS